METHDGFGENITPGLQLAQSKTTAAILTLERNYSQIDYDGHTHEVVLGCILETIEALEGELASPDSQEADS